MRMGFAIRRHVLCSAVGVVVLLGSLGWGQAKTSPGAKKADNAEPATTLEREFFNAIREGDTRKFLSYVPENGINIGPQARATTRADIEQQILSHHGIYCKLFDSSCIDAPIKLDASSRGCSYRELLTHSEKVRTAATETTRNNVRQAILVAEVKNDQCPNDRLIDFIFNLHAEGWKLFSLP